MQLLAFLPHFPNTCTVILLMKEDPANVQALMQEKTSLNMVWFLHSFSKTVADTNSVNHESYFYKI
jgi:hypothetical protein